MSEQVSKIFISCDSANHVCDKSQYKEATLWEKIKLNIHLIYCSACRTYTKNNSILTKTIKKSKVETMDNSSKDEMRRKMEEAMKNNS